MPKPTQEQEELWQMNFAITPYCRNPPPAHPFIVHEIDEYPAPDEQGRRQAEGFRMSYEATVQESELA